MKHVKRIVGFVLALVMVLALSAGVFAAAVNEGRITIDNAITGQTYTIWKATTKNRTHTLIRQRQLGKTL